MRAAVLILGIFALFTAGCQLQPGASSADSPPARLPGRPLAYVGGQPVVIQQLQADLVDLAGRQVLREYVLDQALEQQLDSRGWQVGEAEQAAERERLLQTLSDDQDQAVRLLHELRAQRGLGPRRFKQLLWRNAALRRLVADEVTLRPAAVRQAYDLAYGPRQKVRVIVTPTLRRAVDLRTKIENGQSFADLAVTDSTDPSSASGGLLPPMSLVDPGYPKALRQAVGLLSPGKVSPPVSVEGGFAILKLEATIPAEAVPFEQVEPTLARRVRLQAERVLMDQLARDLLGAARVVVLDADLHRVWDAAVTQD